MRRVGDGRDYGELARDVVAVAREKQVTLLAASVAYYGFNSLLPLLALLVVLVSLTGGSGPVLGGLEALVGADAGRVQSLLESQTDASARVRAGVVALAILLWSALRTFRALASAFAAVYGTRKELSPVQTAMDVALALATIVAAVGLLTVLGAALSIAADGWLLTAATPPLLFVGFAAVFLPMYYVFPEPDLSPRDVLPGATFAAALWTAFSLFFRSYASTSEGVQLFGAIGAVLLLLTWFYVGGLVLLVGVVVNGVVGGFVDPDHGWLPEWVG